MIVYYLSTLHVDSPIPKIPKLQPFLYSFYVATLVLNVLTTGMLYLLREAYVSGAHAPIIQGAFS